MATRVLIIDQKNNKYEFRNNGELIITKDGKSPSPPIVARLITPIQEISLRKRVWFLQGTKMQHTSPIKGCMVDD